MGNNEGEKTPKSEKPASPPREQSSVHVYPDWVAVQAYYGPGAMPPAYYNPAAAPGHAAHPYIWAPPQMVPPYGSPYAAMYPHGGIYGASTVPGTRNSAWMMLLHLSVCRSQLPYLWKLQQDLQEMIMVLQRSVKKLISTAHQEMAMLSVLEMMVAMVSHTARIAEQTVLVTEVMAVQEGKTTVVEVIMGHQTRDERELKREKRKQSNRESARRSRLRKQAEMEELGRKVEALTAENLVLRSEINKLEVGSEKLRSDNGLLMERLKNMEGEGGSMVFARNKDEEKSEINTENLLERVDNSMFNGDHP